MKESTDGVLVRRNRNEHFIESEGAAINVSFTLLANFSLFRNFIFLSFFLCIKVSINNIGNKISVEKLK